MKVAKLIALAWLSAAVQDVAGDEIPCWPGECNVQSLREMVLTAYAEVNPRLDAVVVGRIEGLRHEYGNDEVGAKEFRYFQANVRVERSLAGCLLAGDRLILSASGYGGWHWRERSPEEMAPVLAIAEANMELEREADERDDRHWLRHEMPKHLKRNRERLIALGVARQLPFVVLRVRDNDLPSSRRRTDVVMVPGRSYLLFTPSSGETSPFGRRRTTSELMFDIYPASFAEYLPPPVRPESCDEAGQ